MIKKILLATAAVFFTVNAFCCTSAIFTGKVTKDGRPLMWKNRDTDELNNRIEHFKGPRFDFLALVNSPHKTGEAWAGNNSAGFCIMNTASYNIQKPGDKEEGDGEGVVMFKALGLCKNLKDFENFLDTIKKPNGCSANFGVIDAEGGAAYYEVNNYEWTKTDVNDPKIAPEGYLVYTNFSYGGRYNEGHGYIRYANADLTMKSAMSCNAKITPEWIMNNLSRSYYHSVLNADLTASDVTSKTSGWFMDQDFIPRESTSAVAIFQGIKTGDKPDMTIMWCAMSYPPISILVPMFVKYPDALPEIMVKQTTAPSNCKMCDMALALKENVFPIKRGNGYKYFRFSKVYNNQGTGFMQQLAPAEKEILKESEPVIEKLYKNKLSKTDLESFNSSICKIATDAYANIK